MKNKPISAFHNKPLDTLFIFYNGVIVAPAAMVHDSMIITPTAIFDDGIVINCAAIVAESIVVVPAHVNHDVACLSAQIWSRQEPWLSIKAP